MSGFSAHSNEEEDRSLRFESRWNEVERNICQYCTYRLSSFSQPDIDDVIQDIRIAAWRGFNTLRDENRFRSWVMKIAENKTNDIYRRNSKLRSNPLSLDEIEEQANTGYFIGQDNKPRDGIYYEFLREAVLAAVCAKDLSEVEAKIIMAYAYGATPDEIEKELGISGSNCAVYHCRALPKLRVFLFTQRPNLLGGSENIRNAFTKAKMLHHDQPDFNVKDTLPLSEEEADVFQRFVLEKRANYRKRGWYTTLREACNKVVKQIELSEVVEEDSENVNRLF